MSVLFFVFQGVFPVFLLIVIGAVLKRRSVIGSEFSKSASALSFKLALPALGFSKIAVLDFSEVFFLNEIIIIAVLTLLTAGLSTLISLKFKDPTQKGAFIQGSFRGNIVIIAIALVMNLYGEAMAARAAMILAFMLPLFNILAVIVLTLPLHGLSTEGLLRSLKGIITNPIILCVVAGMIFSLFRIPVPPALGKLLGYLADLALPLALINIGASLTAQGLKDKGKLALISSLIKILILPVAAVILFYTLGYRQEELGMVFLICGAPAAVSSHIMAESMGNDGDLAALIVMISTALAAITAMVGISIIQSYL
ncbi:MAG: AEC family transporter [Spirochaetales bacterium]|nr:AEC family transporter [Spirochaetales bacterium]